VAAGRYRSLHTALVGHGAGYRAAITSPGPAACRLTRAVQGFPRLASALADGVHVDGEGMVAADSKACAGRQANLNVAPESFAASSELRWEVQASCGTRRTVTFKDTVLMMTMIPWR
jgi:hypothetical protein